jgi:hypothetical protein
LEWSVEVCAYDAFLNPDQVCKRLLETVLSPVPPNA